MSHPHIGLELCVFLVGLGNYPPGVLRILLQVVQPDHPTPGGEVHPDLRPCQGSFRAAASPLGVLPAPDQLCSTCCGSGHAEERQACCTHCGQAGGTVRPEGSGNHSIRTQYSSQTCRVRQGQAQPKPAAILCIVCRRHQHPSSYQQTECSQRGVCRSVWWAKHLWGGRTCVAELAAVRRQYLCGRTCTGRRAGLQQLLHQMPGQLTVPQILSQAHLQAPELSQLKDTTLWLGLAGKTSAGIACMPAGLADDGESANPRR